MKIILDTSVLISIFLSLRRSYALDILKEALEGRLTLVVNKETLEEFETKITTPKIKKQIKNIVYSEYFLSWYRKNAVVFPMYINNPHIASKNLRDRNDLIFIDLILSSKAQFLITLDKDLLVLKQIKNTKIMKPDEFMQNYINKK